MEYIRQAKEKAPCIVFIDEIDAIGKKRDGQMGFWRLNGVHQEQGLLIR